MAEVLGNEKNMAEVQEAMKRAEQANAINQGGDARNHVPIDFVSEYGNQFKGIVEFKRPTLTDTMRMGGIKSNILGNAGITDLRLVDSMIGYTAHIMATLKVVIVKCPEWLLDIDAIKEPDLLFHVYEKYEEWENSFRVHVQQKSTQNSGASAGA